LNTEIKLPNLDYAVGWPTAPKDIDDSTVRKVIDIAIQVATEWPKLQQREKSAYQKSIKMTIGPDRAGCICSARAHPSLAANGGGCKA